jgi:hypothetical protein
MANWVWNYLKVSGKPERIKEFKEKANLDGRVFNFKAFVPFDYDDPSYQNLSEKYPDYEPIEGHEQFNFKDWVIDHWGTNRNSLDSTITEETDDSIGYSFTTAWQPPSELLTALEKLYPDLEFFHDYSQEIDDEGAEYLLDEADDEILSNMLEFANIIKMDDENIEKFKKLYGEGRLSFSQIIPEVQKNEADEQWFDNSQQDASIFRDKESEPIGKNLARWRLDNWGTPSDLLYEKGPSLQTLEGLLKGEYEFFTRCRPPIGIYEKMAADGLVFETEWRSDADDEWAVGKGLVVKGDQVPRGIFRYNIDAVTEPLLKEKTDDDLPF